MPTLFDVDIRGLQQTLAADAPRILMEPIANALDTDATAITIRFSWARGFASYVVEDNDPKGFAQLSDAFTMFAPSQRKGVATARGRFGFGEKEFVALCFPGSGLDQHHLGDRDLRPQRAHGEAGRLRPAGRGLCGHCTHPPVPRAG